MKKWFFIGGSILVIGVIVILIFPSLSGKQPEKSITNNTFPIKIAEVAETKFADFVEAVGTTFAYESAKITPNVTEVVEKINFKDGQAVKKRDVIARLENASAVLLGKEPSQFSLPNHPLEALPPIIPSQIPSEVLKRRPDIWIGLKTMEAENAHIGATKANLFPNITLSAEAGYQGRSFENLLTPQSFAWTLGGGLLQPLFNYGRNHVVVEAIYAQYRQVADVYQQSVLSAFEEVEYELANLYFLHNQYQRQQQTVEATTKTLDLARQRYEAGLVSYLEVVDVERTTSLNQLDAVGIVGQLYQSTIRLSLAVDGNWHTEPQFYQPDIEETE